MKYLMMLGVMSLVFINCGGDISHLVGNWGKIPIGIDLTISQVNEAASLLNNFFNKDFFVQGNRIAVDFVSSTDPDLEAAGGIAIEKIQDSGLIESVHIFISTEYQNNDPFSIWVMCHELGHALGYFHHSVEASGIQANLMQPILDANDVQTVDTITTLIGNDKEFTNFIDQTYL